MIVTEPPRTVVSIRIAIVPLSDLRRLRAVERRASAEVQEDAEIEATLAAHQEWVAAGRPGAVSHEEAMAELLGQ
jgi:hypothetical protein